MHDFLVWASRAHFALNARKNLTSIGTFSLLVLAITLCSSSYLIVRIAGNSIIFAAITVIIFIFLTSPREWIAYLKENVPMFVLSFFIVSIRMIAWICAGFLSILYFIWPLDLIPDFIVLFGWIEDLAIGGALAFAAYRVNNRIPDIVFDLESRGSMRRLFVSGFISIPLTFMISILFS